MMKRILAIVAFVTSAAPLFAQHAANGYTGFALITPAQISIGRDNNFLVDRTPADQKLLFMSLPASVLPAAPDFRPKTESDNVFLLTAPTLGFVRDSIKQEFSFTYQPEFEIFQSNSDQNSWNHYFAADYSHLITRRTSITLGDAYRSSSDASRTLQNVFLLLPRGRYTENNFRVSLGYAHSQRTSYAMRFDNTISTFGQSDPLQRNVIDTISKGVSFAVSRMVRRNHRVRGTYTLFHMSPWNKQKIADDRVDHSLVKFERPGHSVYGEYRFSINPITVFEFSGGLVRTGLSTDYIFGIFGDRRFGELWLGGGYSRYFSFLVGGPRVTLPNGFSSHSFYDMLNVRLRGQPTRTIGLNLTLTATRSVYGTVLENSKAFMGRARIDYRLTDRTVSFLSFESFNQNKNTYVGTPLSRNRMFLGLEFSLASDAQRRTSRMVRDAETVALTDHRRQRTSRH